LQQHNLEHSLQILVYQAKQGEQTAMAALYHQFNKAMFNICTRMMGNITHAEDVLQEAFILAFKNLHQLKEAQQFGGWLKRIVVNECIKQGKKSNQLQFVENEGNLPDIIDEQDWWIGIDISAIHKEIKHLPSGCRQVFTLYVLEDYSHKEIAETMGISEGTSKSQYSRAKQLLKEKLTKQFVANGQL
jgi:RNA polymerase sigma factor (sigma-70 family)